MATLPVTPYQLSMNLPLPSGPADRRWLEALSSDPNIRITIPLFIETGDDIEVVAATILRSDSIDIVYYRPEGWRRLSSYDLREEAYIHEDDLLYGTVSFVGTDAIVVRKLARTLGTKLEELWRLGFVPYSQTDKGDQFEELQEDCDCLEEEFPEFERFPGISEIEGETVLVCPNCYSLVGIEHMGKDIFLEQLFDDDWVFTDPSPGEFVEVGDNEDYALYTNGEPIGRLERVISAMSIIGGSISSSFSKYNPINHQALVFIRSGEVAGYLTWEDLDDLQVLRQLFVRAEFRRQGIATTIVETWCDEYCRDGVYYMDEPNEKSRSLFEGLGHTTGDGEFHAIELFPLRGVGNSIDESMTIPK